MAHFKAEMLSQLTGDLVETTIYVSTMSRVYKAQKRVQYMAVLDFYENNRKLKLLYIMLFLNYINTRGGRNINCVLQ